MAKGVPIAEQGRWSAAVRSALQFLALLQRVPSERSQPAKRRSSLHVRAHGSCCALCSDALWTYPKGPLSIPRKRERKAAAVHYRTLFDAYGTQLQDISLRFPNRRLYIGPYAQ